MQLFKYCKLLMIHCKITDWLWSGGRLMSYFGEPTLSWYRQATRCADVTEGSVARRTHFSQRWDCKELCMIAVHGESAACGTAVN